MSIIKMVEKMIIKNFRICLFSLFLFNSFFYPIFTLGSSINEWFEHENFHFYGTSKLKKLDKKNFSMHFAYSRVLFSSLLLPNASIISEQESNNFLVSEFKKKEEYIIFHDIFLLQPEKPVVFFDDLRMYIYEKNDDVLNHVYSLPFSDIDKRYDAFLKIDILDTLVTDYLLFQYPPLPSCEIESPPSGANAESSKIAAVAWLLGLGILGLVLIRRRVMR